ncbi:hypothetical protein CROQUDRAFT_88396 [Cronartium quercuum f. sp. fusiforme G11]|uniref:Uncharacterized protein n=1 Tax=Cronartium quercuum f. sp. fusiforme G11 TaxID=708437 RepID=A0A9P6NV91_9BASI|nr:hypothetical protein CROQUDRAFT_88396 [Cronartium quercuum f. sp. fusiforme G11]
MTTRFTEEAVRPAAPNPPAIVEEELRAIEGRFLAPTQPSPTTNPLTPCAMIPKTPRMQRVQDILGEANMCKDFVSRSPSLARSRFSRSLNPGVD